jgi:dimethylargininase
MLTHAVTRLPGENFADGITTSNLGRPNYELIIRQHAAYRQALHNLGLEVLLLPPEPAFPDAYFVEDPAIVSPSLAIITRPGAASRRGEEISLERALKEFKPLAHIRAPGTLDGGDVLFAEDQFFIGLSKRTNREGARQLSTLLEAAGYPSITVNVASGLHLKSSVNYIGNNTMLITSALADHPAFTEFDKILLDPNEEYAANTLLVNDTLLVPAGFPKTRKQLDAMNLPIIELDVSEVRKMDGGLTCMSLRF